MVEARVLVVDDSAAMRALFCDVLDRAKNVQVVGTAASAAEAREQIPSLKPNVLTLDVEMPGTSGIEFLEEVMTTSPMPVVMLSSLTQSGTTVALKAYELGAVECFPKPLKATPEQFNKMVGQLGKIVVAAANSKPKEKARTPDAAAKAGPFQWNGRPVVLSASMGGIDALGDILAHYPKDCPPTVIVLQAEQALAEAYIARADGELPCTVRAAKDGATLVQGCVYLVADPACHAVIEAGTPPRIRLVARDPIEGMRPSANLLFGSVARTGMPTVGAVLTGMGDDGAKGLKLLHDAGCDTFVQSPETALVGEAPEAAIRCGGVGQALPLEELALAILARCNTA